VATQSARFLGRTGDLQYGPVLLRHLEQARGNRASHLAMALGDLGYQETLPLLLNRFTGPMRGQEKLDLNEFLGLAYALGQLGGEEARAT